MTQSELERRQAKAQNGTLVISRTDDGFRVFNPAEPSKSYIVAGSPEQPTCTCPDFEYHNGQGDWRCKHILAVLDHVAKPDSCAAPGSSYENDERGAIQGEGEAGSQADSAAANGSIPQMLIKRSVSPDGRIDSLSVEFSCFVEQASPKAVRSQAESILDLQSEVVESFLNRRTNGSEPAPPPRPGNNGAVPAQMLTIGGMDGKWGRRLFITFQSNGQTLKLFGNRKQLGEALMSAGYAYLADHVNEGALLNLPCHILTKPSPDGRYVNVERVLPPPTQQPATHQKGWRQ